MQNGLVLSKVSFSFSRILMFFLHIICDCLITLWQVRTILDINCGFGSFAAHLASLKIMTVCIAPYEATGSQVQLALERGLPAVIGNFIARQLPYPSLSYDMVHCAQCGIIWDEKGNYIILLLMGIHKSYLLPR